MLCVLIRIASMRRFYWEHTTYLTKNRKKNPFIPPDLALWLTLIARTTSASNRFSWFQSCSSLWSSTAYAPDKDSYKPRLCAVADFTVCKLHQQWWSQIILWHTRSANSFIQSDHCFHGVCVQILIWCMPIINIMIPQSFLFACVHNEFSCENIWIQFQAKQPCHSIYEQKCIFSKWFPFVRTDIHYEGVCIIVQWFNELWWGDQLILPEDLGFSAILH